MTKKKSTTKKSAKLEKIIRKQSWADYVAGDLRPKHVVYRFDSNGDRFYYFLSESGVKTAIGVTTAFGAVSTERQGIERWKEAHDNWRHLLNISADYGTQEHILFEGIVLGQGVNKNILETMKKIAFENGQDADMPAKDTLAFLKFYEDYHPIPLLIEAQLVWVDPVTDECLAMTIDLLAKMTITDVVKEMKEDGVYQRGNKKGQPKFTEVKTEIKREVLVLVDFKSNFFEKAKKTFYEVQKMQLIGGAKAIEQNFGIKVDGIYNYAANAWRTTPSYTFYEHRVEDRDLSTWGAYWNLVQAKKINVPSGNILICDTFKNSSDFKLMSYQEYAESVLLNKEGNEDKTIG